MLGMPRTGRPTDFTDATREAILATLRQGNFRESAARAAGISPRTLQLWLSRGRREKRGAFGDFFRAVLRAEMDAESLVVAKLHSSPDLNHAKWWLERRFPQRWSLKVRRLERQLVDLVRQLESIVSKQPVTRSSLPPVAPTLAGPWLARMNGENNSGKRVDERGKP